MIPYKSTLALLADLAMTSCASQSSANCSSAVLSAFDGYIRAANTSPFNIRPYFSDSFLAENPKGDPVSVRRTMIGANGTVESRSIICTDGTCTVNATMRNGKAGRWKFAFTYAVALNCTAPKITHEKLFL